ncbi:MAG TPA: ABC transporter ATP-binding protein [Leptospiraceae bacterium]|nr:ABC transporter ATP-binding protein [Leptospiraceae bacterium]HMX33957.1 ABC transporter ATP-binding protein [Leptospiraceae bacterium]HMY30871.1 ABC transporter ATP-binding protein [Leptospiraceae bacterium]HMZ62675.1 ABC transporter ATP-binding protein [Leptospiraceae bacterium]HNA08717.1 ABC transporter ATP-binding protein [Leptospiraceae bacterium]
MFSGIQCINLNRSFGDPPIEILKNLNFEIPKGQFVSVTGRSGSGKSTLLYAVSGLDKITSGKVLFSGESIHEMKEKDLNQFRNFKMGFVFQFHYLLPEISVLDNVLMPARKTNLHKEKMEEAKHILEDFSLSHCIHKLPGQISGGESQRVSIARALIMRPEYIFADEPTGNLDSVNGEKVLSLFQKVNKDYKTTILMVTHDAGYARLAQRTIRVSDGIIESDTLN